MTIREALSLVDELKPNSVERARKIGWLSDLDRRVFEDIFATHEPDANTPATFDGYTTETDEDTVLLVRDPDSEVYRWYLEMQIDLVNMELAKHNNSLALFDNAFKAYSSAYNRKHKPICTTQFKY